MSRSRRHNRRGAEDELSSGDDASSSTTSSDAEEVEAAEDRDLSPEEMDKLVQLQDLTGIDNLGTCRALLENKNWDLESAAREHLNLPSVRVHPEFQQRVPEPPVEAPEARQVLRPPAIHPRNNRNAVVPIGHTLFSWGVYLLTLPLRMTYRTVSSVFSVVLSILGFSDDDFNSLDRRRRAQILSSNTRPEQDVGEFLQEFNSQYTQDHVPFHSGSYSNALEEAKKDLKFLLVYLHCPSHQDVTFQHLSRTLPRL
jgi:FAS-associated factor 2